MESFVNFGDVLRYYRIRAGLSQEQLAEGISAREYVGLLEKNKKIPTIYMISAFSRKMGINLFDAYALIIEHNDFDTHKKIEAMDEVIKAKDIDRLYELATEYSSLPGFSDGVPRQCISHAFSLYYSNALADYEKSVEYATEGLAVSGVPGAGMIPTPVLSITDLCLLLVKSVNLCRCDRLEEGRKYFEYLRECTRLRFTQNRYIANRNRRFDINLFALTTYNICEFFPDDNESNLKLLEESIRILNDYDCSSMQPELLLYKARCLHDTGDAEGAYDCFSAGYYLLASLESRESAEKEARKILGERYDTVRNPFEVRYLKNA